MLGFDHTLNRIDGYALTAPFTSSPILFRGNLKPGVTTVMVGACAADGYLYAFSRKDISPGPVWRTRIDAAGHGCTASGTFDNTKVLLFQAGDRDRPCTATRTPAACARSTRTPGKWSGQTGL